MSTAEPKSEPDAPGGPARRGGGRLLVAALVVGLVLATLWLLKPQQTPEPIDRARVAGDTAAAPGTEDAAHFAGQGPAPMGGTPGAPSGAAVAPLLSDPATAGGWRDIQGIAVRASDERPIASATIIAVPAAGGTTDEISVLTDSEGRFALHVPAGTLNFRVRLPETDSKPEPSRTDRRVPVRIEWANDDPRATELRLVLDSGWRLDLRVIDGQDQPCAGALVQAGGRKATCDAKGLCTLLDLPVDGQPLTVTVQAAHGGKPVTQTIDAPADGVLRRDETVAVP